MELLLQTASCLLVLLSISLKIGFCRHCYGCSGHQCLQNPADPTLFPGRVKCHDVMEYCTTHIRYLVNNQSLASNKPLSPLDYQPHSVTRQCAKVWLGNLCRRDFLGRPEITCISTCDQDLCNCHSRSPPQDMFRNGSVLYESPKRSKFKDTDLLSCRAMEGVPGYGGQRIPEDDYEYYNQIAWERRHRKHPRRMRNTAAAHGPYTVYLLFLLSIFFKTQTILSRR